METLAYRSYFNRETLDDALLKSYVTPRIAEEASKYVESVALSLGVQPSAIITPTPFMVSQLAMYWAYFTAALRKASYSVGKEAEKDSFHFKARYYQELLNDLLNKITADTFTGGSTAKKRTFPSTMAISRN